MAVIAFCAAAFSQTTKRPAGASSQIAKPSTGTKTSSSEAAPDPAIELQKRLQVSQAALQSGDPSAVRTATRDVLALALRQMAELRMVEGADAQAAELFKQSFDYEDVPDAHFKLAIALLRIGDPQGAIQESQKVIALDPNNAKTWKLQGTAWTQKEDYRQAAHAYERALKLHSDVETAYSLAICFLDLHEKDKAKLVFQDMISNYGDQGTLHVLFGRAYRDANDLDAAIAEFRRAIAIDPKTPHAHYFLGLLLLTQKEWGPPTPEIRAQIQAELKRYPRDFLSNYLLGLFATTAKHYEESDHYLGIAAEINPAWPDSWLIMGQNAFDQHQYERARPLLEKAVQLTGNDEARNHYQARKAYIDLGRIALDAGKKDESEKYFAKARELQKKNLELSQQAVTNVMSAGGAVPGMGAVMPVLDSAAEAQASPDLAAVDPTAHLDPSVLEHAHLAGDDAERARNEEQLLRTVLGSNFNDLAVSEARNNELSAALADFKQAAKWEPSIPGLQRNLGAAAFRMQDYKDASQALTTALADNPQDNVVRATLGLSDFFTGSFAQAADVIKPLGQAAVDDPGLAYPWAESLVRTGQFSDATKLLDSLEARSLPPDTLFLIGQAWSEMTNYDRAIKTFHSVLQQNATFPKAHFQAGLAYLQGAHPVEAAAEFQKELTLNPNDDEAKYNLAYSYLQESDREKAIPLLKQVIEENPQNAEAQYQMGKVLLDQNEAGNAVGYLEKAARLAPDKDYIHYQLQSAYRKMARIEDANRELELYKQAKTRNREKNTPQPEQHQN